MNPGDPAYARTTTASGFGLESPIVGDWNNFTVLARDVFENDQVDQTSGTFTISVNGTSDGSTSFQFLGNGTYHFAYQVNTSGAHGVNVFMDGEHIFGSPFSVDLTPGTSPLFRCDSFLMYDLFLFSCN